MEMSGTVTVFHVFIHRVIFNDCRYVYAPFDAPSIVQYIVAETNEFNMGGSVGSGITKSRNHVEHRSFQRSSETSCFPRQKKTP